MARYLETAAEARSQISSILNLVEDLLVNDGLEGPKGLNDGSRPELVRQLAYLYNLGIRTNPRPAQSTVRLRAVQRATEGMPVTVRMEDKEENGRSYKVLKVETVTITPEEERRLRRIEEKYSTEEGATEEERQEAQRLAQKKRG